jgi:hypothetical protein
VNARLSARPSPSCRYVTHSVPRVRVKVKVRDGSVRVRVTDGCVLVDV